jgi:putative intracellular protease/amidase
MDRPTFVKIAQKTGVTIASAETALTWQGPETGKTKPVGPLAGKTVGVLVASEFSDFQAYYLASYLSEFGAQVEFLLVDWVHWKETRPYVRDKGVRGMWGMGVDPISVLGADRHSYRSLRAADPSEYDALVVPGGHSADVMVTEAQVTDLIRAVVDLGGVVGSIGGGAIPLIRAGVLDGKICTGNRVVAFMLEKIGTYDGQPVVRDGQVITAGDTVDTPAFVRGLCEAFDPTFVPERKDVLDGKRILIIAGEDFEDIELVVPVMEYLYRGAHVTLATFPSPMRSRPPMVGLDVVMGNFGVSVPFQEIPQTAYDLVPLVEVNLDDVDVVQIPGAFCPWNMVAAGEPVDFLQQADRAGKILAAICHGPIPLAAADLVDGKRIAGFAASKDAVRIMGGTYDGGWSAVVDGRIVTGRVPSDIPEFLDAVTLRLMDEG